MVTLSVVLYCRVGFSPLVVLWIGKFCIHLAICFVIVFVPADRRCFCCSWGEVVGGWRALFVVGGCLLESVLCCAGREIYFCHDRVIVVYTVLVFGFACCVVLLLVVVPLYVLFDSD